MRKPRPDGPESIQAPICSIFRKYLRAVGLRMTRSRALVLDAILQHHGLFEVEQLRFEMRSRGQIVSKATVYRTVMHMLQAGIIQRILMNSPGAQYELIYGKSTSDYLIDLHHHRMIELGLEEIVAIRDRICREHGLKALGHRLLIYGMTPLDSRDVPPGTNHP